MNGYIKLSDDLDESMRAYETNLLVTSNQRAVWKQEGEQAAIIPAMMGVNNSTGRASLKLLKEDGHDGQPVGSLSAKDAQCFCDYGVHHIFPPARDLVRFGIFMHLDMHRILALALKGEWERYMADCYDWPDNAPSVSLEKILEGAGEQEMRKTLADFEPDIQDIFNLFEQNGNLAADAGYTSENFHTLAREMVLKGLHRVKNASQELKHFIDQEQERMKQLHEATLEEREAFWLERCCFRQNHMTLDEVCLSIEDIRLKNSEIERQWLIKFGDLEISIFELTHKISKTERMLLLKQINPGLNMADLEEKLVEEEERYCQELQALKFKAATAPFLEKDANNGFQLDDAARAEIDRERKRLMREIRFKCHPDHLARHSCFDRLTEKQKEELKRILLESFAIDSQELGFPKGFIEHDMRSVEGLRKVLEKINFILSNAGIDVSVDLEIKPGTLKEQLAWLKQENKRLDMEIGGARSVLENLIKDDRASRQRTILDVPQQVSRMREEISKRIDEAKEQLARLEVDLQEIFHQ